MPLHIDRMIPTIVALQYHLCVRVGAACLWRTITARPAIACTCSLPTCASCLIATLVPLNLKRPVFIHAQRLTRAISARRASGFTLMLTSRNPLVPGSLARTVTISNSVLGGPRRLRPVAVTVLHGISVWPVGIQAQKNAIMVVQSVVRWQMPHPRPTIVIVIPVVTARDVEVDIRGWVVIVVIAHIRAIVVARIGGDRRYTAAQARRQNDNEPRQYSAQLGVQSDRHGFILSARSAAAASI